MTPLLNRRVKVVRHTVTATATGGQTATEQVVKSDLKMRIGELSEEERAAFGALASVITHRFIAMEEVLPGDNLTDDIDRAFRVTTSSAVYAATDKPHHYSGNLLEIV